MAGGGAVADQAAGTSAEPTGLTAWWIIALGFALSIGIGLMADGERAIWVIAALGLFSSVKLLVERLRASG